MGTVGGGDGMAAVALVLQWSLNSVIYYSVFLVLFDFVSGLSYLTIL
jgi:hypothetical protein